MSSDELTDLQQKKMKILMVKDGKVVEKKKTPISTERPAEPLERAEKQGLKTAKDFHKNTSRHLQAA